jgi:hypothetical protein
MKAFQIAYTRTPPTLVIAMIISTTSHFDDKILLTFHFIKH